MTLPLRSTLAFSTKITIPVTPELFTDTIVEIPMLGPGWFFVWKREQYRAMVLGVDGAAVPKNWESIWIEVISSRISGNQKVDFRKRVEVAELSEHVWPGWVFGINPSNPGDTFVCNLRINLRSSQLPIGSPPAAIGYTGD